MGGAAYSTDITGCTDYVLRDSFILDCGVTRHVCNNHHQFHTYIEATNQHLYTGDRTVTILGFGTVDITVQLLQDQTKVVTLSDVAHVPSFQTNTVSYHRFKDAGGYWNTQHCPCMLMFRSHPYATTEMRYRQYIVEYNPLKEATEDTAFISCSAAPRPPAAAPLDTWHLRIGHLHCDALEKLPLSAKGVQFSRTNMSHCETCSLAKAHQIVSHHPADRATEPLVYVHLDLIQVTPAYNNHCWVLHFLDDFSRMNFVYTLATKSELTNAVKQFMAYVKRQYNVQVRRMHCNGERSLGNNFVQWVADEGIDFQTSAPYTPTQNGAAERSGGVIMVKAHAIRIKAKLPEDLWPEMVRTAGYLANRSPSKSLNWMTPYEKLHSARPDLTHLKVFGCHAYPFILKEHHLRMEKLEPWAHIGYLVGYNSTNIYHIWIPSTSIVIAV